MSAFLRKYGVAATVEVPVIVAGDTALAESTDWTLAAGDVKVSKDGGTLANIGTLPAFVGGTGSKLVQITLSATEMQAARIVVQLVDAASVEDQFIIIETYGNASATHEVFPCDVTQISADSVAADNLELMCQAFETGTVSSGSTTTLVKSDRTEADNFWNNSAIVFTSGALNGLTRRVTNYSNTNGTFTVNTLPSAPSASDTFILTGRIE